MTVNISSRNNDDFFADISEWVQTLTQDKGRLILFDAHRGKFELRQVHRLRAEDLASFQRAGTAFCRTATRTLANLDQKEHFEKRLDDILQASQVLERLFEETIQN